MTIKAIYRNFLTQLQNIYSLNEATVITDWVFEKAAAIKRADIIANPDQPVNPLTNDLLTIKLHELLQHKPVQYVLGEAWFCNMKLTVNKQVLIPRPETEELVQLASSNGQVAVGNNLTVSKEQEVGNWKQEVGRKKQEIGSRKQAEYIQFHILDIGTGSGCIAIALKKALPGTLVSALDISEGALAVAKENAITQNETITFLQVDFLDEAQWERLPMFDMIVSNPPYIPFGEKEKLDKNVSVYEPHTALFVPDDTPLLFYQKIAAFGKKHLNENGKIFVEIHEDHAKETASLFSQSYPEVIIKKDIFGKERIVIASH